MSLHYFPQRAGERKAGVRRALSEDFNIGENPLDPSIVSSAGNWVCVVLFLCGSLLLFRISDKPTHTHTHTHILFFLLWSAAWGRPWPQTWGDGRRRLTVVYLLCLLQGVCVCVCVCVSVSTCIQGTEIIPVI